MASHLPFLDEKFCAFCGREENPSYGKFFTAKELCLSVHQYCMVCFVRLKETIHVKSDLNFS